MHEVREFAGHADIRTTEVYFVRKEEDAEVAGGASTFASRDARASEPVAWSNQNPNPLYFYDRSRTFVGFYPI